MSRRAAAAGRRTITTGSPSVRAAASLAAVASPPLARVIRQSMPWASSSARSSSSAKGPRAQISRCCARGIGSAGESTSRTRNQRSGPPGERRKRADADGEEHPFGLGRDRRRGVLHRVDLDPAIAGGTGHHGGRTSTSRSVPCMHRRIARLGRYLRGEGMGGIDQQPDPLIVANSSRGQPLPFRRSRRCGRSPAGSSWRASAARERRNHREGRAEALRRGLCQRTALSRAAQKQQPLRGRARPTIEPARSTMSTSTWGMEPGANECDPRPRCGPRQRPCRQGAGRPRSRSCRIAAADAAAPAVGKRRLGRPQGGETADQAVAVDAAALGMKVHVAVGELADLAETAGDGEPGHRLAPDQLQAWRRRSPPCR